MNLGGGQVGREKEEQSVGWNVEIEVNKAVDEKPDTANKCCQMERDSKNRRRLEQTPPRLKQPNAEEGRAEKATENSCFGKSFHIVVVRVIDHFAVKEGFILRIDCLESSQASA